MPADAQPSQSARQMWLYITDDGAYGPVHASDEAAAERIARARCEATGLEFIRLELVRC